MEIIGWQVSKSKSYTLCIRNHSATLIVRGLVSDPTNIGGPKDTFTNSIILKILGGGEGMLMVCR